MTEPTDTPAAEPATTFQPYLHSLPTVEGLGDAMEKAFDIAAAHQRPVLSILTAPDDGTEMPVSISSAGVNPIKPEMFDPWRANPRFRNGTAIMTSLASFIDHVNRFKTDETALFACDDRKAPRLTAVLDYHDRVNIAAGEPGHYPDADIEHDATRPARHMRHRTTFPFPLSDEWKTWTGANKQVMTMTDFARFLEDNVGDVLDASETDLPESVRKLVSATGGKGVAGASTLYQLATGLKIHESSVVEQAQNLATGEGEVKFKNEHMDANGNKLVIPALFLIAIPVFRNDVDSFRIAARLRYRKGGDGIKFWFDLVGVDKVFDTALREACETASTQTGAPLFFGAPEAS